jgi:hypothetical protein
MTFQIHPILLKEYNRNSGFYELQSRRSLSIPAPFSYSIASPSAAERTKLSCEIILRLSSDGDTSGPKLKRPECKPQQSVGWRIKVLEHNSQVSQLAPWLASKWIPSEASGAGRWHER